MPKIRSIGMVELIERISPETLRNWLDSSNPPAVVDVRDDDHIGGHIKGSINVPSAEFVERVSDIRQLPNDRIVFHCQYSQQRGPSCAQYFANSSSASGSSAKVYVLSGGFSNWAHTFNGKVHTESYRPELYA